MNKNNQKRHYLDLIIFVYYTVDNLLQSIITLRTNNKLSHRTAVIQ